MKHASSFKYDKSLPVVVTSNFRIDDLLENATDVDAIKSRCKTLYLHAPIAENEESEENFRKDGISFVPKPRTRILPEALIGLYLRWFRSDDYTPSPDISALKIQATSIDIDTFFPLRKK